MPSINPLAISSQTSLTSFYSKLPNISSPDDSLSFASPAESFSTPSMFY
jgi:hypothetical protein